MKTYLGATATYLSLLILLAFAKVKFDIMRNKDDTSIIISEQENYLNDTDVWSDKLGFNVAFGVADFGGEMDRKIDPDIGSIKAYYRQWGTDVDGDDTGVF